jgi:exopolysaccharide biosynthesis polyprenyl glycosylphosphotransferase
MITKRETELSKLMIGIQVGITIILFLSIEKLFPLNPFNFRLEIAFISQIILIWSILFYKFRLGFIFRSNNFSSMIRGYLITIIFGSALFYLEILFLPSMRRYSLEYMTIFALVDLSTLIIFKLLFYYLIKYFRRKGYNSRHIIIVADLNAIPFVETFVNARDWGYRLFAIISPDKELEGKFEKTHIINNQEKLKEFFTQNSIDDIFYCLSIDDKRYDLEQLIEDSKEIGVTVHIIQSGYLQDMSGKVKIEGGFDHSFISYRAASHHYFSLKIKEIIDFLFSVFVLIVFFPIIMVIALLIKIEDGGPVLFKQERIGLNGRRFRCLKFRSMVMNAEELITDLMDRNESDGPTFKIENDPRITKIGKFLRKTSLDELPQFYNVIKGEMSVVGPRPPLLREVQLYERSQLRRLSMKPGITCIWQVSGRNIVPFKKWMSMDLDYIDHWSIALDFKIMIATVGVILKANGQ